MATAKKVSEKVAADLHMIHNPFADTTTQPKIPDGKVNDSLGFTAQDVFELKNAESTTATPLTNVVDLLLYPGRYGQLIAFNCEGNLSTRGYRLQQFDQAGSIGWVSARVADGGASGTPTGAVAVTDSEEYGQWRIVSAGLQLKLLNSQEEDDGWWEAIRLTQSENSNEWYLSTSNTTGETPADSDGLIAPIQRASDFRTKDLANDPSYSTGLLRDLHAVQFELHGKTEYHDFIQGVTPMKWTAEEELSYTASLAEVRFNSGFDTALDMANTFCDNSYDMIYLRLHCRPNDENNATDNGSRFHVNCITNQEICFDHDSKENRFQTKNESIGEPICGMHFQGRRMLGNAATLIT